MSATIRDTNADLFNTVLRRVKENGHYEKAAVIMDYALSPMASETIPLSNYQFDFIAKVSFGGSEGIYIDCYLEGEFDSSGRHSCKIGTFKTLRDDLTAMKIMGELAGALTYYATRYVNENISKYEPDQAAI